MRKSIASANGNRMLTIEFSESTSVKCECCGGVTRSLTRFVYEDGDAYAIYYARFGVAHEPRVVEAVVSIGEWGEGAGPWDRVAFPLRVRSAESEYQVTVVDSDESPWRGVTLLGRMLDRAEALQHERLTEVFHISDHMMRDDQELREYLNGAV
jgi:hypothetical protein